MKVLIDMNLSPRWVDSLTAAGIESAHWSGLGPSTASDAAIMAFAAAHEYVVVTHDLDFSAILAASGGDRPSVVQIRADDLSPERIGQRVIAALAQAGTELERGALLTIDVHRTRLRMLPLTRSS
jgi:predicted nuclease of predicted toxin-antitoxin system